MTTLTRLQDDFQRRILGGDAAILGAVVGNTTADAAERVGVYVHAYSARLVEALENEFLTLRFAAGDETGAEMLRDYVAATPSTLRNVRWYGKDLAQFLRVAPRWRKTPAFAELAELDWAISVSFDAADETCITEADIAVVPFERWGEMILRLPQHVRLVTSAWNVWTVRQARDRGQACPELQRLEYPQTWIVSRRDFEVHYRQLEADEAVALETIASGAPFADVCAALCGWHAQEEVALRAAGLLKAWLGNGWISGAVLPD
ncbi:MAG: putative DNA-binding domain-containing protein [Proteobacteria bacterium]|nr:putative DNA-binding domain-containing protein [Pseudomonadota bacterium]